MEVETLKEGLKYKPDIVIAGFVSNLKRQALELSEELGFHIVDVGLVLN